MFERISQERKSYVNTISMIDDYLQGDKLKGVGDFVSTAFSN